MAALLASLLLLLMLFDAFHAEAFLSLHGLIDVASFLAVAVVPAFAGNLAVANIT